jgi:hypothetical protein
MLLFWVVTLHGLIGRYKILEEYTTSVLNIEVVCFSEMLVFTYEFTCCHNPEEHHHIHWYENLKSHVYVGSHEQQTQQTSLKSH